MGIAPDSILGVAVNTVTSKINDLDALGDTRTVVADANAPYFGAPLTNDSLTPGANPHLGAVGFDAWFAKAQKAKAAKVASV